MDPLEEVPARRLPAGYPTAFETDVVLSDGATAHVRPIRPDDDSRLLAFHARQSPESIYYRYFSPRPRLSERDVDHLTTLDYVDRMALVAIRGDDLIGVARYDRLRLRSEAEVAFFVDDANHGRGLATVLLEHLAVRAREVGMSAFTASVLPDNRKMIGVFTAAGFQATTAFADGVVEVRLGLVPTPEAEAAIERRARRAASEAVRRLLSPRSVAVIGASRRPGSIGHELLRNLQRSGFQGPIWPVNPHAEHVGSVRAVDSIMDIADDVDLAVVVVPAASVASVVEECGRKQVYGVVVLSSGFAEAGPEGAALEAEVLRVARAWGIRLVGPNCLGIINTDPEVRLRATFAQISPLRGRVSLLSESGMVGAAIVAQARQLGVGISSFVALGNRADVSVNDLLQYWEGDPHTDIVCMYIESFGNPRRFSRLVRRLSRAKPVVVVKAGLPSASGEALLRQTGVMRVPTLPDLLETTRLLVSQPIPPGRRVAVLGNAGGSLTIVADAVLRAGLERAVPSPASGVSNRLDHGLPATGADFQRVVTALVSDPEVDAVLVLYAPSLGGGPAEVRTALDAAARARPDVPVVACFYGADLGLGLGEGRADGRGVPVYPAIDAAARALGRAADYGAWLAEPEGELVELEPERAAAVRGIVRDALAADATVLDEATLGSLVREAGLARTATHHVEDVDDAVAAAAGMGYPVVLKASRRDAMAKTAGAGLAIDLGDEAALRAAWARMDDGLGERMQPALVQPMVERGIDVAVDVTDHPEVGPVLALGPGGAASALDRAVDVRVLPLTDLDAHRLVAGSRLAPMLEAAARADLEALLLRIGALVEEVPEIVAFRANPVIVGVDGAVLTDVRIEVAVFDAGEQRPALRRV
jgi:acyl-CoA synthetase (NDP forming)/RimJ/RimL family protein N-acetyltransferase